MNKRTLIPFAALVLWLQHCPLHVQVHALIGSAAFAGGEAAWYWMWYGYAFTSIEQAAANVLIGVPFLVDGWRLLCPDAWMRVLLFPIAVWTFELVVGHVLIWLYGKNHAWSYSHGHQACPYCVFRWWGLALVLELL